MNAPRTPSALTAVRGLFGLWAGVVLGGSLVAAPAKFQAASLTLPVALDVGRAQFLWMGVTEGVLCLLIMGLLALRHRAAWRIVVLPAALFLVQRLAILPLLDERTVRIMAGESLPPSRLHLIYVGLEVLKLVILTVIALGIRPRSAPPVSG